MFSQAGRSKSETNDIEDQELTYNSLPQELLERIWSNLTLSERVQLASINKKHAVFIQDSHFWMQKFKIHFPHDFEKYLKMLEPKNTDLDVSRNDISAPSQSSNSTKPAQQRIHTKRFWINAYKERHIGLYKNFYKRMPLYPVLIENTNDIYCAYQKMFYFVKEDNVAELTNLLDPDKQKALAQITDLLDEERHSLMNWAIFNKALKVLAHFDQMVSDKGTVSTSIKSLINALKYQRPLSEIKERLTAVRADENVNMLLYITYVVNFAIKYGHTPALKLLTENPADIFLSSELKNASLTTIRFIETNFVTIEKRVRFLDYLLPFALCNANRMDILASILEQSAYDNYRINDLTFLYAILHHHISAIHALVERDAILLDEEVKNNSMLFVLMEANIDIDEKLKLMRAFIKAKPELLDKASSAGLTPLMSACANNAYRVAECLLELGANVHVTNKIEKREFEKDALYYAIAIETPQQVISYQIPYSTIPAHESRSIFDLLLKHGVNFKTLYGGKTVLHHVTQNHYSKIKEEDVERLIASDNDLLETPDRNGNTPFAYSLARPAHQNFVSAQYLLEHGANPFVTVNSVQGKTTPLYYAYRNGHLNLPSMLVMRGASIKATRKELMDHPNCHLTNQLQGLKDDKNLMAHYRTAKILRAAENNNHHRYVGMFSKKPSRDETIVATTKLKNKLLQEPCGFFTKEEKKVIKAFPRLKYAYKKARKMR